MTDQTQGEFDAARGPGVEAGDVHASLDVDDVLEGVTVVIPSNREDNFTLESIPANLDVVVASEEGLNVARNAGVERADNDWIVIADDDITFPTELTAMLVDSMHRHHLVGLEGFWPMRMVIGRYMVFHRSLWESVGGFDESRSHGGDTDFAIRCEKAGGTVLGLPRKLIPHHDTDSEFDTAGHAEWLLYLLRRHPLVTFPKAVKLGLARLGVLSPAARKREYPDGWQSQVYVPPEAE